MLLTDIDWSGMWKERTRNLNHISDPLTTEDYWNHIAPFIQIWSEYDEYPRKLLKHIQMRPEWSILDVGCGTGAIAIASAMRTKQVTALDISPHMLEILKREAERRFLGNIRYLNRSWEEMMIGSDIKPHDVVIASRIIARTEDLQRTLTKIHEAALRFAYVTAWVGEEKSFHETFKQALGRKTHQESEDIYVYNILCQMGIHPNVLQLECRNNTRYKSPSEAHEWYRILFSLSPREEEISRRVIQANLRKTRDGKYELPDTIVRWSLIWWEKPGYPIE